MTNEKSNNLECLGYTFQELSPNEQQSINGGSGITRLAGWIVGGVVAGAQNAYDFISNFESNIISPCD